MKTLISILTILAATLTLGALAAAQDATTDDEAIDALGATFKEAWNGRDADALGQTYTEDADEINEMGQTFSGRQAILENVATGWEMMGEAAQLDFVVTNRRYITPELAVEDGIWEITGLPEMEPAPPSEGLYTVYLIKQEGRWAVTAGRTRIPVAAPPE